ncbi:MAG TPA: NfeD family protein [Mycobacteriales bacterium]
MRRSEFTDPPSIGGADADHGAAHEALTVLEPLEVAYPLAAVGLLGVVVWLASPAAVWRGRLGAVALAAGIAGMIAGDISAGAVLLLLLAAGALVMEVLAFPGIGLHAAGGGIALLLAGLYWEEEPTGPYVGVIVAVAVAVAGLTYRAGRHSWRRARDKPFDGSLGPVGRRAVVLAARGSVGRGVVQGQLWELRGRDGALREAQTVEVVGRAGDWLIVTPVGTPDDVSGA